MKTNILIIGFSLLVSFATAQRFSENISKEFSFEKKGTNNALMVANINGDIKVVGYEGNKIILTVQKTISAKTQERLEKGKKEIQLGVMDRADTLIFFVEGSCNHFERETEKGNTGWSKKGWGYHWNDCNPNRKNCREDYDYKMSFVLKVPRGVHLHLSTINDGDILVEHMNGKVEADNINGSIKLSNLVREASASTINGNVDIEYALNPDKDCHFYTLNGDINAFFQKNLGASLNFESFNGSFYTNLDQIVGLPAVVVKEEKGDGTKYKLKGNRYKIGNGGANLDFETFNGNVYLKEIVN